MGGRDWGFFGTAEQPEHGFSFIKTGVCASSAGVSECCFRR